MSRNTMSRNLALTNINEGLSSYLEEIKKFPMLTWEEEYRLTDKYYDYEKYRGMMPSMFATYKYVCLDY